MYTKQYIEFLFGLVEIIVDEKDSIDTDNMPQVQVSTILYIACAKIGEAMILLDRVTKVYSKDAQPALNRVSLHIEPKEFVILVGTSGAGKSTLLKLLTREEKPSNGKIVVGGIDYDTLKDKHVPLLRRKIGVVFQDFKLLPQRTVRNQHSAKAAQNENEPPARARGRARRPPSDR